MVMKGILPHLVINGCDTELTNQVWDPSSGCIEEKMGRMALKFKQRM